LLKWGWQWWHWPMFKCHLSIKKCQPSNKKIKKKVVEEYGFVPAKNETLHLLQSMQKHSKWHHGMLSSPHHGRSKGGGSPWGLTANHRCNVLDQKPKDGGGLTWSATQRKKHLKVDENMGW
jgi:hypothetical protein